MRGIAVSLLELRKKHQKHYQNNYYFPIPQNPNLYFIPREKFHPKEKNFFSLKIFIRPVNGKVVSGFGLRRDPFENKIKFHKGIDIACKMNSNVVASAKGKVIFIGYKSGYGKTIIIEHINGYRTLYGHLNAMLVKKNAVVQQGQKIALSGNTGRSTGPHLHFEVIKKGRPIAVGHVSKSH